MASVVCRPSSVVRRPSSVVRRPTFQKSSSLKPLGQMLPNLVGLFYSMSFTNLSFGFLIRQKTWPPLLKIEHRGKLQFFANYSKTVTDIKILAEGKSDQHDKIYLPWNFQEDPTSRVGVIALFLIFLGILHFWSSISWKLNKISYVRYFNCIVLSTSRSTNFVTGPTLSDQPFLQLFPLEC